MTRKRGVCLLESRREKKGSGEKREKGQRDFLEAFEVGQELDAE